MKYCTVACIWAPISAFDKELLELIASNACPKTQNLSKKVTNPALSLSSLISTPPSSESGVSVWSWQLRSLEKKRDYSNPGMSAILMWWDFTWRDIPCAPKNEIYPINMGRKDGKGSAAIWYGPSTHWQHAFSFKIVPSWSVVGRAFSRTS